MATIASSAARATGSAVSRATDNRQKIAQRQPENFRGARQGRISEPLARAVSDAIDHVYGSGYSFEPRSGTVKPGQLGDSSGRHVVTQGSKAAADFKIYDPSGRQLAGKELEPLARHWVANYGSIGINSQPGEQGSNFTHLDLLQLPDYGRNQGPAWTYGSIPGLNIEAIKALAGTGELYSAWANPEAAMVAAGGPVTVGATGVALPRPPTPPGSIPDTSFAGTYGTLRRTVYPGKKVPAPDPRVKALQAHLNAQFGLGLTEDGLFGEATERAVRGLQRAMRLEDDGIAGNDTWGALERIVDRERIGAIKDADLGSSATPTRTPAGTLPGYEEARAAREQRLAEAPRNAQLAGLEDYARAAYEAYARPVDRGDVIGLRRMEDQAVLNQRLGRELDALSGVSTRPDTTGAREAAFAQRDADALAGLEAYARAQRAAEQERAFATRDADAMAGLEDYARVAAVDAALQRRVADQARLNARLAQPASAFSDVVTRPATTASSGPTAAQRAAAMQELRDNLPPPTYASPRDNLAPSGIGGAGRFVADPGFAADRRFDAVVGDPDAPTGVAALRAVPMTPVTETPLDAFRRGWTSTLNYAPSPSDLSAYVARSQIVADPSAPTPRRRPDQLAAIGDLVNRGGFVRQGSVGSAVRELQSFLNSRGYTDDLGRPLRLDSRMGPLTAQALTRYQQDHPGLRVDAIVGRYTLGDMRRDLGDAGRYAGDPSGRTGFEGSPEMAGQRRVTTSGSGSRTGFEGSPELGGQGRTSPTSSRTGFEGSPELSGQRESGGSSIDRSGSYAGDPSGRTGFEGSPELGSRGESGNSSSSASRSSGSQSSSSAGRSQTTSSSGASRSTSSSSASKPGGASGPKASSPAGGARAASEL